MISTSEWGHDILFVRANCSAKRPAENVIYTKC